MLAPYGTPPSVRVHIAVHLSNEGFDAFPKERKHRYIISIDTHFVLYQQT